MLCRGTLAGAAGFDPPSTKTDWPMLEQGCLQSEPDALPLDTKDETAAAASLAAASDSSEGCRVGLLLAAVAGLAGLTVRVSSGADWLGFALLGGKQTGLDHENLRQVRGAHIMPDSQRFFEVP